MQVIWDVYKKYFIYQGRASRKEYWLFNLYATLLQGGAFALDLFYFDPDFRWAYPPALSLVVLVNFLPLLLVTIRRFHDVGLSGWFLLLGLIPIAGGLMIFMVLASGGDEGDNDYGPEPDTAPRV